MFALVGDMLTLFKVQTISAGVQQHSLECLTKDHIVGLSEGFILTEFSSTMTSFLSEKKIRTKHRLFRYSSPDIVNLAFQTDNFAKLTKLINMGELFKASSADWEDGLV